MKHRRMKHRRMKHRRMKDRRGYSVFIENLPWLLNLLDTFLKI